MDLNGCWILPECNLIFGMGKYNSEERLAANLQLFRAFPAGQATYPARQMSGAGTTVAV